MNNKTDKYLDDLARTILTESNVESTSFNFTNQVMSHIYQLKTNQALTYKPLISKTGWLLIALGSIVVLCYALFFGQEEDSLGWLNKVNFKVLSNIFLGFKLSKTVTYSIVLFGFMLCIQIPLLNHHFNKRYKL